MNCATTNCGARCPAYRVRMRCAMKAHRLVCPTNGGICPKLENSIALAWLEVLYETVKVESFTDEETSPDRLGNPTSTSSSVSACEKRLRHTEYAYYYFKRKTGGAVLLTRGVTRRASLPLCRAGLPFHQSAVPEARGCGPL